ncbi:hypothetical protein AgCh_039890 [Apium graveolens]
MSKGTINFAELLFLEVQLYFLQTRIQITQQHLRLRSGFKLYWDTVAEVPPPPSVVQGIRAADFESVFLTGMMRHDARLITAFVDRWCP